MAHVAERTFVSRNTLTRIERGDPGVAIGTYAAVLFMLGMGNGLGDLADPRDDEEGFALEEEWLPQRIRTPLKKGTNTKRMRKGMREGERAKGVSERRERKA